MPFRSPLLLAVFFTAISCSATPKIGDGPTAADRAAEYPTLLPLSTLIATHSTPNRKSVQIGGISGLKARADAIRGPVIDPQIRAKLLDAIKRHRAF